jgi:Domain of unknown function (DUF4091)
VIDDGEKIRRDATATPFERGEQNPVWRPGEPVRLFAVRNESVALQVVVEADAAPLAAVSVALPRLDGPNGAGLLEGAGSPAGGPERPIERFVEHFVVVRRASGGATAGESLGWKSGAAPAPGAWVGPVPDALVPVEAAAPWAPYPMGVAPFSNGILWIDVNVSRDAPPGIYRGTLDVSASVGPLASIPVELEVADATLPDRTAATMLYYDPDEVTRRVGPGAEPHLWKLLHAHRIAPLHDATSPADIDRQAAALDGTLYTRERGYEGPAVGLGDGVASLGAYGALGPPDDGGLARVAPIASAIEERGLFDTTDVFLYAADEQCASPLGAGWRALLRSAKAESVRRVRVGWTCSDDPVSQPVDIAIVHAGDFEAKSGEGSDKSVWVYNGSLPHSGTFLLDAEAVSPRVNGWLEAMFDVPRWFYWDSTYWYGLHGATPVDPFVEPESFHNDDGDWANGDGVLVYPGRQVDRFHEHSLGLLGVIPSIRLKNWRRGIEDAGYLQMARTRDRARADAVARGLIPAAFREVPAGGPQRWSARGQPFFTARRRLLAIALGSSPQPPPEGGGVPGGTGTVGGRPSLERNVGSSLAVGGLVVATLAGVGLGISRVRRRRRP